MKILVVGNSQASMIKQAHDRDGVPSGSDLDISFFVIPGGHGPFLSIKDNHFVVDAANKDFPPYAAPADAGEQPLSHYDGMVVSALGYVDGGFQFVNPITELAALADFGPTDTAIADREIVSAACYGELLDARMRGHHGMRFLKSLRAAFDGPIWVQPFPYPSAALTEREDWGLRRDYEDYVGAHRFFTSTRDAALAAFCADIGVTLLEYPDAAWRAQAFTPADLMRPSDLIHPTLDHGAMILRQITGAVAS